MYEKERVEERSSEVKLTCKTRRQRWRLAASSGEPQGKLARRSERVRGGLYAVGARELLQSPRWIDDEGGQASTQVNTAEDGGAR